MNRRAAFLVLLLVASSSATRDQQAWLDAIGRWLHSRVEGVTALLSPAHRDVRAALHHGASGDLYRLLGVRRTAGPQDLRKARKKMALRLHPDKNRHPRASEAFDLLMDACEDLADPDKRREVDRMLAERDAERDAERERRRQEASLWAGKVGMVAWECATFVAQRPGLALAGAIVLL